MLIPKALCLAAHQMERMASTYHDARIFWHCESPVKEPSERKREGCDCGIRAIERALSINAHLLQLSESSERTVMHGAMIVSCEPFPQRK